MTIGLTVLVERYLTERRTLGFQLRSPAYSLRSLAEYVRRMRHRGPLTLEVMAEWARLDSHASVDPRTWARRLKHLRSFARWDAAPRDEHGQDGCNQLENRMTADALALMDKGDANRRILSKDEYRADFRRVEAASLKRKTMLKSAEGKRIFARCFYSFQASVYFTSTLGRTKLPHESVEKIELAIRERLEAATKDLNQAIDGAELLFKQHGIDTAATYDTVPLEAEIGITSALGRRYFELIHKMDQLMPLLQTLEIEEVITERQVEHQRSKSKRVVLAMASTARNLAAGIRRRMNELDAKKVGGEARKDAAAAAAALAPVADPAANESSGVNDAVSHDALSLVPAVTEDQASAFGGD